MITDKAQLHSQKAPMGSPAPDLNYLSSHMTKPTKWHVHLAKTQISLGIHSVWSESSLCIQWEAKGPRFLHVDSKDLDQTVRMPGLIWVLAGHTGHFVGFVMLRLILINKFPNFMKIETMFLSNFLVMSWTTPTGIYCFKMHVEILWSYWP